MDYKEQEEFQFEYVYTPTPDTEEQLAQVWDLILELLLADVQQEQGETC